MTKLTKILLSVSATGFVAGGIIGFSGPDAVPALMMTLPLGAVFFGLFMISLMMEKLMAAFDEEEAGKLQPAKCVVAPAPQNQGQDSRPQNLPLQLSHDN